MSNAAPVHQKLKEKMDHSLEHLKRDLAGLRTGRASVALLDGVRVDYYGTLTEERRKELSKICKKHGEDTKVQIRGFRRDANEELKKLQKDAKLTEDELRKAEQETQKLTDGHVQKIDDIIKKKEQEILEV